MRKASQTRGGSKGCCKSKCCDCVCTTSEEKKAALNELYYG